MRVVWSAATEKDLEEIGLYIAHDNVDRALSFMDELESKAESLRLSPYKGVDRSQLRSGLRLLLHGNYNIYYVPGNDVVTIVRVLHGARDIVGEYFT